MGPDGIESQDSVVGIATRLRAGRLRNRVWFLYGERGFLSSSKRPDRLWRPQHLIQWVLRVKRPGYEGDHWHLSSADVKNEWRGAAPSHPYHPSWRVEEQLYVTRLSRTNRWFWYRDLNSGAQDLVLFPLRCRCSVSPFTLTLSWPGGCFVWITAFLARRADVRIFVRDHMLEVLGASSNICTLWHAIYDILTRYRNMLIYAINGVSRNACAVLIERTCTVWMT